jgi:hypothetical protein
VDLYVVNPEPAPTLGEPALAYLWLGLWALVGLGLMWEWSRNKEGAPPPT